MDAGLGGTAVILIVAVAEGRVIGSKNELPWRLPEDLRRFKATTLGHPVVMGRKTFESLGKPLPGRTNIVVTRRGGYAPAGVIVARDPPEALRLGAGLDRTVFVIGGAELYAAALPHAREVLATLVCHRFPGDAFFPALGPEWHVAAREDFESRAGPEPLRGSFVRLVRGARPDACQLCALRGGGDVANGCARVLADLAAPTPGPRA